MDLHLVLTVEETNLILEALGRMPFVQVAGLITKIQQQGQEQTQPPIEPGNVSDDE